MPNSKPFSDPEPARLETQGVNCGLITPMIRARLAELEAGARLEVACDDPAAREGIPAWCRMTGHTLEQVIEIDAEQSRFMIRKKL